MATSTVEQYIKVIYQEQQKGIGDVVQMKRLAEAMEVTPGTATTMVKHLARNEYIRYQPRVGVELLDKGRDLAVRIIRRHRLIETFLEQILGYDWSEVHDEAEQLEHAVSDLFVERIDRLLGHPGSDPHGDPIPSPSGIFSGAPSRPLPDAETGTVVTIVRLSKDDKEFLDLMKGNHIVPGEEIVVETIDAVAGIVSVTHPGNGHRFTMGYDIATHIFVSTE